MPVSVSKPAAMPLLEPAKAQTGRSASDIVAQRGGAIDPTGTHVPATAAAAKEEQQKKLRDAELATKEKRAAAASTQKQFFNKFVGVDMPITDLQTKSLTFYQTEFDTSGVRSGSFPKWQTGKAKDFVSRIKKGFKGLKGDISMYDDDSLYPLLARDAADLLKNKELGDNWTNLKNWGPADGRAHGSMPGMNVIKSGLLHVLATEQRRRTRQDFLTADRALLRSNFRLGTLLGHEGDTKFRNANRLRDVVTMAKENRKRLLGYLQQVDRSLGASTKAKTHWEYLFAYAHDRDFEASVPVKELTMHIKALQFWEKAAKGKPAPIARPVPVPGITPVQGGATKVLPGPAPVRPPPRRAPARLPPPVRPALPAPGAGRGAARAPAPAAPARVVRRLGPPRGRGRGAAPPPVVRPPVHPLHNIVAPNRRRYLMQANRLSRSNSDAASTPTRAWFIW
jgi:hypothetical protein